MSDRTSPAIFCEIFTRLASDPTEQHVAWARELWALTVRYDFAYEQLGCSKALAVPGLARRGLNPDFPEQGETWLYYYPGAEAGKEFQS